MMSLNAVWVAVMATVGLFAGGFVHSADRAVPSDDLRPPVGPPLFMPS